MTSEKNTRHFLPHTKQLLYNAGKTLLDITFSLFNIILMLPIFLIVSVVIKFESRGPVIYTQKRVGKDGRIFAFFKFRTSTLVPSLDIDEKSATTATKRPGKVLPSRGLLLEPRITYFGRFLRKSGIDYLPQLFNVLKGDMSAVGPRAIALEDYQRFEELLEPRTKVKPGITGLWQISLGNITTIDDMVRLDIEYIRKRSLWLDCKILFKTFVVVMLPRYTK